MQQVDVLIIGSGIAGLTYALKTASYFPDKHIAIFTKSSENESNTKYAQGGIATVLDCENDSFENHIMDTLIAGDGHCKPDVVEMVVKEAPERLQELIDWGTRFDKNTEGIYDFGLEGGHSKHRILHFKDITGLEIEQKLLNQVKKRNNIHIHPNHLAVDLIICPDRATCKGAYVLEIATGKVQAYQAKVTMLATGGIGQVYQFTTNPIIATGDGVAMAYRAGAVIENMEFIQFHPTALHDNRFAPSFLISEAVRGFGAILRNKNGIPFMEYYDDRKDLAPRDVVSRAIHTEMKITETDHVYLDVTHTDAYELRKHFPVICKTLNNIGIDPAKTWIPVSPAAHYSCGGVAVNTHGETSIKHLLACGECSSTGLHGANRLASNSLLEALVFAHRSFKKTIDLLNDPDTNRIQYSFIHTHHDTDLHHQLRTIRKEVKKLMNNCVSIVRDKESLEHSLDRLRYLQRTVEILYKNNAITLPLMEVRNIITVALIITQQSLNQNKNRGAFYCVTLN